MPEPRPPALTPARRIKIEQMFQAGPEADDRLKGNASSDGFQHVLAVGKLGMLEINKIQIRYLSRVAVATKERDTSFMLAAAYGLQLDMRGRPKVGDRDFFQGFLARAVNLLSDHEVKDWVDNYGQAFSDYVTRQRALLEYMTEKLAALDELVAEAYPDQGAEPEAEATAPGPGM